MKKIVNLSGTGEKQRVKLIMTSQLQLKEKAYKKTNKEIK